ncbi:MAG: PIN domain-containing protein [Opitutaceae bacterium]
MASPRYILDTGPLVAFANAADEHHSWAREVLNALGEAPATCEIVLAEACYLLANSQRAVDLVIALPGQGRVRVEPVLANESMAVRAAVAKYWPAMDVADGCVLQLAERFPRAKIITTDLRDFTIYRRSQGQSLNLIHP